MGSCIRFTGGVGGSVEAKVKGEEEAFELVWSHNQFMSRVPKASWEKVLRWDLKEGRGGIPYMLGEAVPGIRVVSFSREQDTF